MKIPYHFIHPVFLLATLLAGEVTFAQQTTSTTPTGFRAAVVKLDITPEDSQNLLGYGARKSTGIHDRIYHRIVALDDGTTQIYLVSTDICEFSPSEYDLVAAKVKQELGISPMNLWWTVTHTHSAPEVGPAGLGSTFLGDRFKHEVDANYTAMVERKLIEGIKEARQKLAPARLGAGWVSRRQTSTGVPAMLMVRLRLASTRMEQSTAGLDWCGLTRKTELRSF